MENEVFLRAITSLLILGSLYPLIFLLFDLTREIRNARRLNLIQAALLGVYFAFTMSGLLTLMLYALIYFKHISNAEIFFYGSVRNIIKNLGIFITSWLLYYIARKR